MNTAAIIVTLGLILVITILSAIIGGLTYQIDKKLRKKNSPGELPVSVQDAIEVAFRKREQEFLTIYAEERRLAEWIKSQLEGEDINLAELTSGANARALALTIKMAEDEVVIAADNLMKVLQKKATIKYRLANCAEKHLTSQAIKECDALKLVSSQEEEARAWLAKSQENLKKLQKAIDTSVVELYEPKPAEKPSIHTPATVGD